MTCIIGAKCAEGSVIVSDTRVMRGYEANIQSKIQLCWERVVISGSGTTGLVDKFSEAVSSKFKSGEINQACILVNNATETEWFQRMLRLASVVCFPLGRIRFVDKEGNPSGAPLQGQAILYFGKNGDKFAKEFSNFGLILWQK